MIRRRVTAQFALGAPVCWAAAPAHRYTVVQWRYCESRTGTWNEYLLATEAGTSVAWANEADLLRTDEGPEGVAP